MVWGDEPFYLWAGQSLLDGTGFNYFAPSSEAQSLAATLLSDRAGFIRRLKSGLIDIANLLFRIRLIPWILALLLFLGLFAQPWSAPRLRGELALIASLAAPASYIP